MTNRLCAELANLVKGQREVLLLLDFDGTLSEIVARPEIATLRPGNARLLKTLTQSPGYTVGIISGRSLDDVSRRVCLPNLVYGGNHGLEIAGPGLDYLHPDAANAIATLSDTSRRLEAALADVTGSLVENKSLTLTVHYRQVPAEQQEQLRSIVASVSHPHLDNGLIRVSTAKAAIELRPAVDWNKGRALELIRARLAPAAFPIYVGDDSTDEDAFASAQALGGIGVFVGPPSAPTVARRRLETPAGVTCFMSRLIMAEPV